MDKKISFGTRIPNPSEIVKTDADFIYLEDGSTFPRALYEQLPDMLKDGGYELAHFE